MSKLISLNGGALKQRGRVLPALLAEILPYTGTKSTIINSEPVEGISIVLTAGSLRVGFSMDQKAANEFSANFSEESARIFKKPLPVDLQVGRTSDAVVISFGKLLGGLNLNPDQALNLANLILDTIDNINEEEFCDETIVSD